MPTATLTVREVKNKSTGLDISIPTYKENPGLLGSTVDFNVVVVSRLAYFKSPKHKETDVVQFMIPKRYPDFEQLFLKMEEQFPGTILPSLPKKVLRLTESVIKDRKSKLENFLKFLACTPKLSTCSTLLEFLGVNAIKAGRYRKGDVSETEQSEDRGITGGDIEKEEEDTVTQATDENLFGETDDATDSDLFGSGDDKDVFDTEEALTGGAGANVKLFEDQDFGGGIQEGEGDDLLGFIPEAHTAKTRSLPIAENEDMEDNSDLLKIEDDLDRFLVTDKKLTSTQSTVHPAENFQKPDAQNEQTKPLPKPKPDLPQKPSLPQKPVLKEKPKLPGKKPVLPKKPSQDKTVETSAVNVKEETTLSKEDNSVDTDDILKYIQENSAAADDDLDLFS